MDQEYAEKMAALDGKVAAELKSMDEKVTNKIKDIESLLARNSRPAAGCLTSAQVDPWGAYSPSTASPGSRSRSASVPATQRDDGYDPCKIWVKGFRRPLMRCKLIEQYDRLLTFLPDDLKTSVKHNIRGPNSVFSFCFTDASLASRAYEILRNKDIDWEDRVSGFVRTLKIYRDQRLEDRTASRVVSKLWEPVKTLLTESGRWKDTMKLLNSGRQLWIVEEDEPFPVFKVDVKGKDEYDIVIVEKHCTYYGISAEAAAKFRAAALPSSEHVRE
jgi:hypothetical protein